MCTKQLHILVLCVYNTSSNPLPSLSSYILVLCMCVEGVYKQLHTVLSGGHKPKEQLGQKSRRRGQESRPLVRDRAIGPS